MQFAPAIDPIQLMARAEAHGQPAWAPGLAEILVNLLWETRPHGLTREAYGTTRWRQRRPDAPRVAIAQINGASTWIIERLDRAERDRLVEIGLVVREDARSPAEVALFGQALRLLDFAPGLLDALTALVRSIHVIASAGPGYDASHSDPNLPHSIFVSVAASEPHAALRLAEAILHEGMHLQLTLLEGHVALVSGSDDRAWSPWQRTIRPALGLLHGLFVFRTIYDWLATVERDSADADNRSYGKRRRAEIKADMDQVAKLPASPALTAFGRGLAIRWLET